LKPDLISEYIYETYMLIDNCPRVFSPFPDGELRTSLTQVGILA